LAARLRRPSDPVAFERPWPGVDVAADAVNPANLQLQSIAVRVKDGVREGLVGQFDPITLEPPLGALNAAATACERINHTPTPRQYDYFTRLAVAAFSTLLPLGLLGALPPTDAWWAVPLTVVIAGVFIVLERVGAILDAPFANTVNDVPITAICRDIERDLLEQLDEPNLPDPVPVVAGYLW
jgi:ion channel-forming bestrophin family protein